MKAARADSVARADSIAKAAAAAGESRSGSGKSSREEERRKADAGEERQRKQRRKPAKAAQACAIRRKGRRLVGAGRRVRHAGRSERLAKKLNDRGYEARVTDEKPFRVRIGRYARRADAIDLVAKLKDAKIAAIVVEAEKP